MKSDELVGVSAIAGAAAPPPRDTSGMTTLSVLRRSPNFRCVLLGARTLVTEAVLPPAAREELTRSAGNGRASQSDAALFLCVRGTRRGTRSIGAEAGRYTARGRSAAAVGGKHL